VLEGRGPGLLGWVVSSMSSCREKSAVAGKWEEVTGCGRGGSRRPRVVEDNRWPLFAVESQRASRGCSRRPGGEQGRRQQSPSEVEVDSSAG